MDKNLLGLMLASQIVAGDSYWDNNFNKPRALSKRVTANDLKPEYDLIAAKKSKLSSRDRALLVARYTRLLIQESGNE